MLQPDQTRASRPRRLWRKLSAYAAAGVSMLAGGPVGELQAAIVHVDLGLNGETIPQFGHSTYGSTILIQGAIGIDFDQDGAPDFRAVFHSAAGDCGPRSNESYRVTALRLFGNGGPSNLIVQSARALAAGEIIRTDSAGVTNSRLAYQSVSDCDDEQLTFRTGGPFLNSHGYVGLVFLGLDNAIHAGWADIAVSSSSLTLYGFAYETEPGVAIAAGAVPEPPSLVLLAAGAAGLAARRRRAKYASK